jgi:hypothetical protein
VEQRLPCPAECTGRRARAGGAAGGGGRARWSVAERQHVGASEEAGGGGGTQTGKLSNLKQSKGNKISVQPDHFGRSRDLDVKDRKCRWANLHITFKVGQVGVTPLTGVQRESLTAATDPDAPASSTPLAQPPAGRSGGGRGGFGAVGR